jgi:hypothetical protein
MWLSHWLNKACRCCMHLSIYAKGAPSSGNSCFAGHCCPKALSRVRMPLLPVFLLSPAPQGPESPAASATGYMVYVVQLGTVEASTGSFASGCLRSTRRDWWLCCACCVECWCSCGSACAQPHHGTVKQVHDSWCSRCGWPASWSVL